MNGEWGEDMVILTRQIGDSVVINKDICITVLGMLGNKIRLGIDAPTSTSIERQDSEHRVNIKQSYQC